MKKNHPWMVLLFFVASTLQQCTDDGESAAPEKVQFTCSFAGAGPEGGRTQVPEIPDALLLSLTTSTGQTVFLHKKITLLRVGESFITEPLELRPGQYLITGFMLVTDETNVVYATPHQGSPLAKAVNHPLPYPFSVSKSKASNIAMEVIAIDGRLPEDFGFTSFPITPVNPLEIAVFIPQGNDTTLAGAKTWIVEGDDTIKQYHLGATINLISFPGDPRVPRKLIVIKPGYNTVVETFIYADLIGRMEGLPWKIMLTPSVFTLIPWRSSFEMTLSGQPGTLSVDWGDGTDDVYVLSSDGVLLAHVYGSEGTYEATITGDLDKIEYLYNFYGAGAVKAINLQGLTGLQEIRMGYTEGPAVMDFSHNTRLAFIMMPVVAQLKTIILPENSIISYADVGGPNQMTTPDIDYFIDQVYAGVLTHRTMDGAFLLPKMYNVTDEMLGPPSPDRVDKLRDLRDSYNWHNTPDPL